MQQFLVFDMLNRTHADADMVEATSPPHACQEFAAALDQTNNAVNREPYILGVRYAAGDPNLWDFYRVVPEVVVTYKVDQPSPVEIASVQRPAALTLPRAVPTFRPDPRAATEYVEHPRDRATHPDMPGDPSLYK